MIFLFVGISGQMGIQAKEKHVSDKVHKKVHQKKHKEKKKTQLFVFSKNASLMVNPDVKSKIVLKLKRNYLIAITLFRYATATTITRRKKAICGLKKETKIRSDGSKLNGTSVVVYQKQEYNK